MILKTLSIIIIVLINLLILPGEIFSFKYFFPSTYRQVPPWIIPNDYYFKDQWGLNKINAHYSWYLSKGDGIIIGIIDTGVDLNHPDLYGKILPGYDYVNSDYAPQDDNGHGTHVAGIAAAATNNFSGVAGMGWNAKILPVKVLNASGSGYVSWIANGITGAADNGAKIINLSLGSSTFSATIASAINYAGSLGALVVAAVGNCGDPNTYIYNGCSIFNPTIYPAADANVLGVGATDIHDNKAIFSSYGSYVDVSAPGVNILSTIWGNNYAYHSGTSMAAPFVSGLAALVLAKNPSLSYDQVGNIIVGTADDLGPVGKDIYFGYGRINAAKAVASATSNLNFQIEKKLFIPKQNLEENSQFEPGTILVRFKNEAKLSEKMSLLNQINVSKIKKIEQLDILELKVDQGTEIAKVKKLMENPAIEYAEPNYLIHMID